MPELTIEELPDPPADWYWTFPTFTNDEGFFTDAIPVSVCGSADDANLADKMTLAPIQTIPFYGDESKQPADDDQHWIPVLVFDGSTLYAQNVGNRLYLTAKKGEPVVAEPIEQGSIVITEDEDEPAVPWLIEADETRLQKTQNTIDESFKICPYDQVDKLLKREGKWLTDIIWEPLFATSLQYKNGSFIPSFYHAVFIVEHKGYYAFVATMNIPTTNAPPLPMDTRLLSWAGNRQEEGATSYMNPPPPWLFDESQQTTTPEYDITDYDVTTTAPRFIYGRVGSASKDAGAISEDAARALITQQRDQLYAIGDEVSNTAPFSLTVGGYDYMVTIKSSFVKGVNVARSLSLIYSV